MRRVKTELNYVIGLFTFNSSILDDLFVNSVLIRFFLFQSVFGHSYLLRSISIKSITQNQNRVLISNALYRFLSF